MSTHRLVFIKKEFELIQIFIFHTEQRGDIIRLMLHRDAVKRVVLYFQENMVYDLNNNFDASLKKLFSLCNSSDRNDLRLHQSQMIEALLASHLTKKENRYVHAYWLHRSVQAIAQSTGLSRSYINNILLSAAHKLGLVRAQDLLAFNSSTGILLQREHHETRSDRYQSLKETA